MTKITCPECRFNFEIADELHQPKGLGSQELKEVLRQNFQKIEELSKDRKFEPGISSGFPELKEDVLERVKVKAKDKSGDLK